MRTISSTLFGLAAAAILTTGAYAGSCSSSSASKDHSHDKMNASYGHEKAGTIIDTAVGAGTFNTLVAAVKAAGLVDVLSGDGPFTVFAPTDEAFAKLPEGTVESLLEPKNIDRLRAILTYHVVPGKVLASDVVKLDSAKTVQGTKVKIKTNEKGVSIDEARVIKTDIETSNGVIHVIDSVILPPVS